MRMKRLLGMITLVLVTSLSPVAAAPASAQASGCSDIAAYIDMVDTQVADEMHTVVTAPGWVEDAQRTEWLLDGDSTRDGRPNPLVQYLSVPGVVLAAIDPADIPEGAGPLHESATTYWVTNSSMIEAMVKDGPSASFPFLETLDKAAAENNTAQADIVEQCPEIPESYKDARDRLDSLFAVLDGEGDPGLLANTTPEDLEGMGFFFLFFGEEDVEANRVAADSTPTTVKPIPATPED
jgi:hypothetical protein